MRTVEQRLRINGGACAGNILEATAFFAGNANAVARLINEEIALSVGAIAMDVVFFGKIAEDEKYHVADMLVAVKIVSLVCFADTGKLRIVDHRAKLVIRKLDRLQDGSLGANEQNIDSRVGAGKREKLSGHQKLTGNEVLMRRGAEDAGNDQADLSLVCFLHDQLGTAAGAFELDHITRKRQCADDAENGSAAFGTTVGDGCILGL